ncbi:MAG: hypothetical protein ACTSVC_04860 [Promethearchaeota archaeon]
MNINKMDKMDKLNGKFVEKTYYCSVCKTMHQVKLRKTLVENEAEFPIMYPILHGDLMDILSIIYLDKDLNIRGVESSRLKDDNLFSKDQVVKISTSLMNEIERLQKENEILLNEINRYQTKDDI